ncbi:hypothetical protein niasHT_033404 [Heterodera trifolii]|uniref:Uncharacterized protein n=1 Tax=Heterodera trifolii TaxID=157864 RepID=A0ABD2HWF0_9BILA
MNASPPRLTNQIIHALLLFRSTAFQMVRSARARLVPASSLRRQICRFMSWFWFRRRLSHLGLSTLFRVRAMSELLRISITPMVVRLKMYIETAQENLGKELTDQSVRADLLAERQTLCKTISLLEKYNGKWEAIFLRVKGQALQDEEQNYRDFKPEGLHALGLSELGYAISQPNQPAQVVQQPQLVHQRHEVTLPPITLPKFSGEPREWPLFWKLFETSVESLQIEDFKKHIYLLGCLPEKSVARRAIDLYPPSDENYPRVVEILKKRFGDEKTMVECLQAELLHLAKPAESVQSLRQFSESIERICHQLLDYGENEQNKFMASTIKSKLPYHLLTQVVEKEMRAGGAFNCTELRRAIASIVEVKEEVQRCTQIFRGEETPRNFPPHSNEGRANQGRGTPFRFFRPFREERWRPVEGNEPVRRMSPQPNHSFSAISQQQSPISNRGSNRICFLCETKGHAPSRCTKYTNPGARRKRLADQERSAPQPEGAVNVVRNTTSWCVMEEKNNGIFLRKCRGIISMGGGQSPLPISLPRIISDIEKSPIFSKRNRDRDKANLFPLLCCGTSSKSMSQIFHTRSTQKAARKTAKVFQLPYEREEDKPSESITFDGKSTVGLSNVINKSHAFLTICRAVVIPKHDHQKMIEKPILFDQASQTSYQSDSYFVKGGTETNAYPTNQCNECKLLCFNKGVKAKIPTEINKVELCCAENCYIHENVKKLTYELSKEILLNDYQCQGLYMVIWLIITASQNWTSRRVYRTMAFVVLMANSLQDLTGAETIAVMAKSEKCIKNATSMKRIVENSATLTLLPVGQTNTLLLKTEEGVLLGSINVVLKALALECQSFTKAWQRSYAINVLAVLIILYLAGGGSFGCGVESRPIPSAFKKFCESSLVLGNASSFPLDGGIKGWRICHPTTLFKSSFHGMPIPIREGPYFSARRAVIPENAEILNDRLFGDENHHRNPWFEEDWEPVLPLVPDHVDRRLRDPRLEEEEEERANDAPLRRERRVHGRVETLSSWIERFHEHRTVMDHYQRMGHEIDPFMPCLQEYVGFSPHEGGMLVDLYPVNLVNIRTRVGVAWRAPAVVEEPHPPPRDHQLPDGRLENRPPRVARRLQMNRR